MIVKDFYCKKCQEIYKDIRVTKNKKEAECPECGNIMHWVPSKMHFKPVPGGHNDEYKK